MCENTYDDPDFFQQYSRMTRSVAGLNGAGEWHELRKMLPPLAGARVLDLGCGYGWHCRYAAEMGASRVVGVDVSERMLAEAARRNALPNIEYLRSSIESASFPADSFDVVLSSLAFHYLESFDAVCEMASGCLRRGGDFVFSVEHPIFTAQGPQDWFRDADGTRLHWPVDDYFRQGARRAVFLGSEMRKYHRTLASYLGSLLGAGYEIVGVTEPEPEPGLLESVPGMRDELRRPMMLLVAARRK